MMKGVVMFHKVLAEIENIKKKYPEVEISPELYTAMKKNNINVEISIERLLKANAGAYDSNKPLKVAGLPEIDGVRVIKIDHSYFLKLNYREAQNRIDEFNLPVKIDLRKFGILTNNGGEIHIHERQLEEIGKLLAPVVAYGMLNGGSASSYVDKTSNVKNYHKLVELYEKYFDQIEGMSKDLPKGVTPAYVNPNGTLGYNFMELRERALLIKLLEYQAKNKVKNPADIAKRAYQMFQMTSDKTHKQLQKIIGNYDKSEILKELIEYTKRDSGNVISKEQPLMAVWTQERPYKFFTQAYGKENSPLAMPGGHGHNFEVMKDIYKSLYKQGYKIFYLGNVDNSANVVNDKAVALLALTGRSGLFEFSMKTPADVKGGIAVETEDNNIDCGDLGVAVSKEYAKECEDKGLKILFNTASGYFSAKWLNDNVDEIVEKLPMRVSKQNKDAGSYSQAEQVTWEIMGMMRDKIVLAVDKYDRFIAAKMLIELLMASRIDDIDMNDPRYTPELREIALNLQRGLEAKLTNEYQMKLVDGAWVPKTVKEIIRDIKAEMEEAKKQVKKVKSKGKKGRA